MGQRVALRTATDVVEAAEDDGQSSLVAIAESGTWTGGSAEELAALILDCLHPRQKKRPHGMAEVADRLLVVSLHSVPRFYVKLYFGASLLLIRITPSTLACGCVRLGAELGGEGADRAMHHLLGGDPSIRFVHLSRPVAAPRVSWMPPGER